MYDLLIKNGLIADGTGKDAFIGDIGIKKDKIYKIGDLSQEEAAVVLDARGKVVTPGFIEPHSHADMTILYHPSAESYLMQGVTTVVTGNCGHGMAPMGDAVYRTAVDADRKVTAELDPAFFPGMPPLFIEKEKVQGLIKQYFDVDLDWCTFEEFNQKCETLPIDCNLVPLLGHSAVRNVVMGMDCRRAATEEEIRQMEVLTRECMEQGSFGFSTGKDPMYEPSVYGTDEEIIRLLKIVKEYDGIFTSHTANFVNGTFDRMTGYEEFFRQAKEAGIRSNISHVQLENEDGDLEKAMKEARELIAYFEKMEAEGIDLTYDILPVADVSFVLCPYLASVFSPFVRMLDSRKRFAECLAVPDFRRMIRTVVEGGMLPSIDTRQSDGIFGRFFISSKEGSSMQGKTISELAHAKGMDSLDYVMDLLQEDPDIKCGMNFQPCREAYDLLINHRMAMPCIDNSSSDKEADYSICPELPEYPAPFYANAMACYIKNSTRKRLEDTIYHMTGMVAKRFQIPKRGVIEEGYYADLVVLDPENLKSYENNWKERKYPDGFEYVIVNGTITVKQKQHLGTAAGKVLRKVRE